jgi:hypothetical protein
MRTPRRSPAKNPRRPAQGVPMKTTSGNTRPTRTAQVNAYLAANGFPGVMLYQNRAHGYCYFSGGAANDWYATSVMVPYVSDLTLGEWLEEAQDLAAAKRRNPRRKNPLNGVRIAGPAVKTMVDRLRISKADAQRLKDMMDTGAPRILQTADKMMNGNGVERISGAWAMGGGLMYVNMGDTYDTTLIYDYKTNRFVVSSWGDIVERQPRRFAD